MSVSVSGWVVNGIRLWCSIRLGRPSLRLWLGAGVMMGLAILVLGCGWCGCGFRSMRVCR